MVLPICTKRGTHFMVTFAISVAQTPSSYRPEATGRIPMKENKALQKTFFST